MNEEYLILMDEAFIKLLSNLSTVENNTIWYIDDIMGYRMTLDDYIKDLRREVERQKRQVADQNAGQDDVAEAQ